VNNDLYQKLDRSALWLFVGELGGAALLLVLLILMVVGNLISSSAFDLDYNARDAIAVGVALVYGLAYLGNLVLGIMGLYLYANEKREGYPGTGHLVNWTLLAATIPLALVLIVALFGSM